MEESKGVMSSKVTQGLVGHTQGIIGEIKTNQVGMAMELPKHLLIEPGMAMELPENLSKDRIGFSLTKGTVESGFLLSVK